MHGSVIFSWLTTEIVLDAALGEILTTAAKADWIINHGAEALVPEPRKTSLMLSYKRAEVHYEPLGTVAAITSWNYRKCTVLCKSHCESNVSTALHNSWGPIMAALFSGNAIVLKCSEHVIWSTSWFVGAIRECLRACGYSEDLVQVVCCYPEDAHHLTKSPLIKHITFIGSENVGKIVSLSNHPPQI
jgi:acyl-CoA reductase-like NAD-dependent aldehyde dehydrogenase